MIMVNTPQNPSGAVFHQNDLVALEEIAEQYDLILTSEDTESIIATGNLWAFVFSIKESQIKKVTARLLMSNAQLLSDKHRPICCKKK